MSLSKHHNLNAPSTMTSDKSLSCLPKLPPHPPCGQQPARQYSGIQPANSGTPPSEGPPSTVPTAAAPAHPSSNYPNQQSALHSVLSQNHQHQRLLWSPTRPAKTHHPLLWAHWPRPLPHPNAHAQDSVGIGETHGLQQERPVTMTTKQ